jgi:hypothetical protein
MKKQSTAFIGAGIAILLILITVISLRQQKNAPSNQPDDQNEFLADVDSFSDSADESIKKLDAVDETLDDSALLDEQIENKDKNDGTPPAQVVETGSLDSLLQDLGNLENASDSAISNLDSIDEKEDVSPI